MKVFRSLFFSLILATAISIAPLQAAFALPVTWSVTKVADTFDGTCDADCSLREAIFAAAAGDTIIFDASLAGQTITLGSYLYLGKDLTIDGSALSSHIEISGGDAIRVLYVQAGVAVNLVDLDITNGNFSGNGAGIYNLGTLNITNCSLSDHISTHGGAVFNNEGIVNVVNSTFSGNSAGDGGAIYTTGAGSVDIANSTFSGNSATAGSGGAIYTISGGEVTILNSTFAGNSTTANGAGLYNHTGNLTLKNTIMADSVSGEDCYTTGTVVSAINNLIENNAAPAANCGTASVTDDPNLLPLADNGGATPTYALDSASPAIDAGNTTVCSDAPVGNLDQRGIERTYGAGCDIGSFEYVFPRETFLSNGTYDGWVRESTETSGTGGASDPTSTTFLLGDDASDRQYRAILHFDTSTLPDDAIVKKATLKIKRNSTVGTDPFSTHGNIVTDIRSGAFYGNPALQWIDFKAVPSLLFAGTILNTPTVDNWYIGDLKDTALPFINRSGDTQLRLRFYTDDNDDAGADYLRFYSGNHSFSTYQPVLEVDYDTP